MLGAIGRKRELAVSSYGEDGHATWSIWAQTERARMAVRSVLAQALISDQSEYSFSNRLQAGNAQIEAIFKKFTELGGQS